jgi:hypothetical protein
MNISEGARRMQSAGRWIFLINFAFMLCLFGADVLLPPYMRNFRLLGIVPLLFPILALSAALWLAGWIVEGFAKDAH